MALETLTFYLKDFGGNVGLNLAPRVIFRPNGAAARGNLLFASRPVIVDEFDNDGRATVQLENTDDLEVVTGESAWYEVWVERLADGIDYVPDTPKWKMRVRDGVPFADLFFGGANPLQYYIGPGRNPNSDVDEPIEEIEPTYWLGWIRTNGNPELSNLFEWGVS